MSMLTKSKTWLTGSWKIKDKHSLEYLKLICAQLSKHHTISDSNYQSIIETLRILPEILAWGEKHDCTVLDFFMEKNMLSFFLNYMKQTNGNYISLQLLQSLNLIFQNINNKPFIYYLLSNNHVNSIILHKFNFSNEEVMAYYITFLKLLSFKLNENTIHFFYNEHLNDFALYTEAIKFFNHPESMIRISVRTITLNVFKVRDVSMLKYIKERTAAPYFSNLVWYMGSHALDIDVAVQEDREHSNRNLIRTMIDEHIDYLLYLTDILNLNIEEINSILEEQFLGNMLLPLHIYGIIDSGPKPRLCSQIALFLLSLVFTFVQRPSFLKVVAKILTGKDFPPVSSFVQPPLLQDTLSGNHNNPTLNQTESSTFFGGSISTDDGSLSTDNEDSDDDLICDNITDEQKLKIITTNLEQRKFLSSILDIIQCNDCDYHCLLSLMLLSGLIDNYEPLQFDFESILLDKLFWIIIASCDSGSRFRLITLEFVVGMIERLEKYLLERHLSMLEAAKEEAMSVLQNFYNVWAKSEEIFIELFEDEVSNYTKRVSLEDVARESAILLPPTSTPLTGIDFKLRLPCGEAERARRAICIFLIVRDLNLKLKKLVDEELPLIKDESVIKEGDVLDLNYCDLIACKFTMKGTKERCFITLDNFRMIVVEPENKRLGWGIVRCFAPLQKLVVTGDHSNNRILYIRIPNTKATGFIFDITLELDDHIRCMMAKQKLTKGRSKIRAKKMEAIANLINVKISKEVVSSRYGMNAVRKSTMAGGSKRLVRLTSVDVGEETTEVDLPIVQNQLAVPYRKMKIDKDVDDQNSNSPIN